MVSMISRMSQQENCFHLYNFLAFKIKIKKTHHIPLEFNSLEILIL